MSRAAERVRATLRLAVDEAEAAIGAVTDAHEAWEIADALNAGIREATPRVAKLRATAALRIKDQDALSLRGLADKIGVAPSRAERMVNAAKAASEASQ